MRATYLLLAVVAFVIALGLLGACIETVGAAGPDMACYGAGYSGTVTAFAATWLRGVYSVTVDSTAGVYTLGTARLFRVGQAVTLKALVCDGQVAPTRVDRR